MINIDIEVRSKKWQEQKNIENLIEKTCQKIIPFTDLKLILNKNFQLELAISLVSDVQMKKINFSFRGKNKSTNVLSFSNLDEKLIHKNGLKKVVGSSKYLLLGDVVIAYETVKKESIKEGKKFSDHLTHLILHAILHLIGHDHEDEKMAKIMEKKEVEILQKIGIKNPYLI